ncbi:transmembrane reductase CYB561D2-like [Sitodiplosis mosellana]|uniref:transmembrane reductase CYB561D2-like n=1 Tax=Sitodiplosis mosellana TaxID=263140 RepID=UPI002444EFC2|nr:transmembrane reductase CYB561D2-like [Sitodiplosis mosellana]
MALHQLMRAIGLFVVATVCYISVHNGTSLFTWHPCLMSVGFILLMSEAIVAFSSKSFIATNLKYNDRLNLHGLLQFSAATLIGIAFYSIYTHKNNNNYDHFASRHGNLGFTTCIMVGGTTVGGIAARYSGLFKKSIKPAYLKIIHSTFGVMTYIMAIFTFCLGLDSEWFRSQSNDQVVSVLIYLAGAVALLALIKPLISIATKLRNTFKTR